MPRPLPPSRFIALLLLGFALLSSARAQLDYSAPYSFTTLAGTTNIGSADGSGNAARFNGPAGITLDASGNLYVADLGNHTIRKISPAGVVTTLAGSAGNNGSVDGTGTATRFESPGGIAIDSAGTLYVADSENHTIRKITPAGVVTTFAGLAAAPGSNDGTGASARFNYPYGLALDAAGNVYVADTGNSTIRKITPAGVVTTLAGTASSTGNADGTGQNAKFNLPFSLAADANANLYVADTYNHAIRKISPDGVVTTVAGGSGEGGYSDGSGSAAKFNYPYGITVGPTGVLYVADTYASTIRQVTTAGVVTTLAGMADKIGGTDGTAGAARFSFPFGISTDSTGTIFVVDTGSCTIRKISSGAVVTTLAGMSPESARGTADGTGSSARFSQMEGAVIGPSGVLYVSDTYNHTIRKITPTGIVTTYAGSAGTSGRVDGARTTASFKFPTGLTFDPGEYLYIADSENHLIRMITPDGGVSTVVGNTNFYYPYGICYDGLGNFFVADTGNSTIRKISADGSVTILAGIAGKNGSSDGTGGNALFRYPQAVLFSGATGFLYVADTGNSTIRKISPEGVVSTLAGLAENTGAVDGSGSTARFNSPVSLTADGAGNLYVADQENNLIRKITPAGVVSTIAGQPGVFGTADGTGRRALFLSPSALAVDASGRLYVASSTTIRMGVPAKLPVFTAQPTNVSVKAGESAVFSGTANGPPDPTYQWHLNGVAIAGATGSSLTISNAQTANAGDYTLVATNDVGSATSAKATLTVSASLPPPSSSGGGGGGAPSIWFGFALLALAVVRGLRRP